MIEFEVCSIREFTFIPVNLVKSLWLRGINGEAALFFFFAKLTYANEKTL